MRLTNRRARKGHSGTHAHTHLRQPRDPPCQVAPRQRGRHGEGGGQARPAQRDARGRDQPLLGGLPDALAGGGVLRKRVHRAAARGAGAGRGSAGRACAVFHTRLLSACSIWAHAGEVVGAVCVSGRAGQGILWVASQIPAPHVPALRQVMRSDWVGECAAKDPTPGMKQCPQTRRLRLTDSDSPLVHKRGVSLVVLVPRRPPARRRRRARRRHVRRRVAHCGACGGVCVRCVSGVRGVRGVWDARMATTGASSTLWVVCSEGVQS